MQQQSLHQQPIRRSASTFTSCCVVMSIHYLAAEKGRRVCYTAWQLRQLRKYSTAKSPKGTMSGDPALINILETLGILRRNTILPKNALLDSQAGHLTTVWIAPRALARTKSRYGFWDQTRKIVLLLMLVSARA